MQSHLIHENTYVFQDSHPKIFEISFVMKKNVSGCLNDNTMLMNLSLLFTPLRSIAVM